MIVVDEHNYASSDTPKFDFEDEDNELFKFQKDSIFEKKIDHQGINGYFWGVKNFKNSEGKLVEMKDRPVIVDLHGGPHGFTGA